jgi:hypothetical protein
LRKSRSFPYTRSPSPDEIVGVLHYSPEQELQVEIVEEVEENKEALLYSPEQDLQVDIVEEYEKEVEENESKAALASEPKIWTSRFGVLEASTDGESVEEEESAKEDKLVKAISDVGEKVEMKTTYSWGEFEE